MGNPGLDDLARLFPIICAVCIMLAALVAWGALTLSLRRTLSLPVCLGAFAATMLLTFVLPLPPYIKTHVLDIVWGWLPWAGTHQTLFFGAFGLGVLAVIIRAVLAVVARSQAKGL
jgi:hypothetical protein